MKRNLLFVMNNLTCGGAEKALISLLETIDYASFNVDLFLFKHEGLFLKKIPRQVHVLKEPDEYKYFDMPIRTAINDCFRRGRLHIALSRMGAGYIFRSETNRARCDQRAWKFISFSMHKINKTYDAAIGYLESNPIYFCIDKVKANRKIGFIHTDYEKLGLDPKLDKRYFSKLDTIVAVSEECKRILNRTFPLYKEKIRVMYNIVSPSLIAKMSEEPETIIREGLTIASVGRLHYSKGFDMAVQACEMLVNSGYKVKWYVVGEGEERGKLERLIKEKKLEQQFILTGVKENPYPYIKQCDIYVQTSLFEGQCLTVKEAKILKKPIVSTNFAAVVEQIKHEVNGLIVMQDPASIYKGIKRLIDDQVLRKTFIDNLSDESLGTEAEINKFYQFIG